MGIPCAEITCGVTQWKINGTGKPVIFHPFFLPCIPVMEPVLFQCMRIGLFFFFFGVSLASIRVQSLTPWETEVRWCVVHVWHSVLSVFPLGTVTDPVLPSFCSYCFLYSLFLIILCTMILSVYPVLGFNFTPSIYLNKIINSRVFKMSFLKH